MPINASRRVFVRDLGLGTLAVAVFGAACTDSPATTSTAPTTAPTSSEATASTTAAPADAYEWHRVEIDFVSAFILSRRGEAVVVDTGVSGSAGLIESGLGDAGLAWDDVAHVIITHNHPDHMGSLEEVMTRAGGAQAYAGAADIPTMSSPRPITAVGDGDTVMDLEIIETPGHTPGHISVLDPGRFLVAGDAVRGSVAGVVGPDPQFTADMPTAIRSVFKLGGLVFPVALFGHGNPLERDADAMIAQLAGNL